jgi:hypothetical protein
MAFPAAPNDQSFPSHVSSPIKEIGFRGLGRSQEDWIATGAPLDPEFTISSITSKT